MSGAAVQALSQAAIERAQEISAKWVGSVGPLHLPLHEAEPAGFSDPRSKQKAVPVLYPHAPNLCISKVQALTGISII